MCVQTDEKWLASRERKLVMELAELKGNGQMELYRQQSQAVLKQLKKDYKRQTKN